MLEQPRTEAAVILDRPAQEFLTALGERFRAPRDTLLGERARFYRNVESGTRPDFLSESAEIRSSDWLVAPPVHDLEDRRVEITGPVDRKRILHALNSGANVFMADFEDAHSPTWGSTVAGQQGLIEAVRRSLRWFDGHGPALELVPQPATLMVRPRGWHLDERHFRVAGKPIPASLLDFGLYFHHNVDELRARGTGPYFYLPKIEHYGEAELWSQVFRFSEEYARVPPGTIRATVLIETLPAVFEMNEILYALRSHAAGLNLGRWDYIFSFIKTFRSDASVRFPDRSGLTMDQPFLANAARLLVHTCHRRGIHAIGGMAAQIPIRGDPEGNERAFARVEADKVREVRLGYDGSWVAHPALVPVARKVFDSYLPGANQIDRPLESVPVRAEDLLRLPDGVVTLDGVRTNVRAPLRYMDAWLRGTGAVAIDHRMEDAATVEIARAQLWKWVHQSTEMADGERLTADTVRRLLGAELTELRSEGPADPRRWPGMDRAARLIERWAVDPEFPEFFTPEALDMLESSDGEAEGA